MEVNVHGWQWDLKSPLLAKGTQRSKNGNGYIKVQGRKMVTKRYKVGKGYLKVPGWQKMPKGPWFRVETTPHTDLSKHIKRPR